MRCLFGSSNTDSIPRISQKCQASYQSALRAFRQARQIDMMPAASSNAGIITRSGASTTTRTHEHEPEQDQETPAPAPVMKAAASGVLRSERARGGAVDEAGCANPRPSQRSTDLPPAGGPWDGRVTLSREGVVFLFFW